VHLVGFITKKFVTMHGHMNEKFPYLQVSNIHSQPLEALCSPSRLFSTASVCCQNCDIKLEPFVTTVNADFKLPVLDGT